MTSSIAGICEFIDRAVSPYHAVNVSCEALKSKGFIELLESDENWDLHAGGSYFVSRSESSLFAFRLPKSSPKEMRIVGSHTDSPCLKLKSNPIANKENISSLQFEVYGGALLNSWFDRDLKLAGRVAGKDSTGRIVTRLVETGYWTRIPQLAIHLNRSVNESFAPNPQTEMQAFLGHQIELEDFVNRLKTLSGLESISAWELCSSPCEPSRIDEYNGDFLNAPRLDNLAMLHASLEALLTASTDSPHFTGLVSYDHEEIGSNSAEGAKSNFLPRCLDRISSTLNWNLTGMSSQSLFLSADMAHAFHPGHESKFDPNHFPLVNKGPVLKVHANKCYATDALGIAKIKEIASEGAIPLQIFQSRNDLSCGSTIGPSTAALLGMPVVDIGNPMFSMHSSREMMGTRDHELMIELFGIFFKKEFL